MNQRQIILGQFEANVLNARTKAGRKFAEKLRDAYKGAKPRVVYAPKRAPNWDRECNDEGGKP